MLQIRVRALAQLRNPEQLSLTAVYGRIAVCAAETGELRVHRVIVALCCVKAAGGDHHLTLAGAVIAAGVAAGNIVRHKGQRHRQLPVDEQL